MDLAAFQKSFDKVWGYTNMVRAAGLPRRSAATRESAAISPAGAVPEALQNHSPHAPRRVYWLHSAEERY